MGFKIYISAAASELESAARAGLPILQRVYRTGRGGRLYRAEGAPVIRGGLAGVHAEPAPYAAIVSAASELSDECAEREFGGAFIYGSGARAMCRELTGRGVRTYCGAEDAERDASVPVIKTAMSGGSLEERVRAVLAGLGAAAAEIELTRMDFALPERSGEGRTLTPEELNALSRRAGGRHFYSGDLAAFYFRYREGGKTHFVLYDNSESINRKLKLLADAGAEAVFLSYAEFKPILDKIKAP